MFDRDQSSVQTLKPSEVSCPVPSCSVATCDRCTQTDCIWSQHFKRVLYSAGKLHVPFSFVDSLNLKIHQTDMDRIESDQIVCLGLSIKSRLRLDGLSDQGPVVQSVVSLTSSLRGQLIKCFMTL